MTLFGTISAEDWNYGAIKKVFSRMDPRQWVLGREVGAGGFRHYQFAIDCAGDLVSYNDNNHCGWHIETASTDRVWTYCKKEGRYSVYPFDHVERELRRLREYRPNRVQRAIVDSIHRQNDRSITFWIDSKGGNGKTVQWLLLVDKGKVLPVPRRKLAGGRLSAWICDSWEHQEIIWIDLPRDRKIDSDLCGDLEEIKDGIVFDDRNRARWKIIRGTKILVTMNQEIPPKTCLSLS